MGDKTPWHDARVRAEARGHRMRWDREQGRAVCAYCGAVLVKYPDGHVSGPADDAYCGQNPDCHP